MTTSTDAAHQIRTALAHQLTAPDDPWRTVLEQVPRHLFVPSFFHQGDDGRW